MSVTNTNSALANFNNGGRILIETGASTYLNLLNVVENGGSLTIEPGRRERVRYWDRGVIQPTRLGKQMPTRVTLKINATSAYTSTDIMKLLMPIPTNDTAPTIKMHVEIPTNSQATTGLRWTFAKCVMESQPRFEQGDDLDTWTITFIDDEEVPEPTAYVSVLA